MSGSHRHVTISSSCGSRLYKAGLRISLVRDSAAFFGRFFGRAVAFAAVKEESQNGKGTSPREGELTRRKKKICSATFDLVKLEEFFDALIAAEGNTYSVGDHVLIFENDAMRMMHGETKHSSPPSPDPAATRESRKFVDAFQS